MSMLRVEGGLAMMQSSDGSRRSGAARLAVFVCLVAIVLAAVVAAAAASGTSEGTSPPVVPAGTGEDSAKPARASTLILPPVQPVWVKTASGAAGERDTLRDVAISASGVIYACGSVTNSADNADASLVRVRSDGTRLGRHPWDSRTHRSESMEAIAIARDGSVYTVGSSASASNCDIRIIKWSATGRVLWTRAFDGRHGADYAWDVVVDKYGAVTVCGEAAGAAGDQDAVVVSWSSNGKRRWAHRISGRVAAADIAEEMAVDTYGNIYVAGSLDRWGSRGSSLLVKYSRSGKLRWRRTWRGADADRAAGTSVVLRPGGGVYVGGWEQRAGQQQAMILRYSSSGRRASFAKTPADPYGAMVADVAVASNKRVAGVGYSQSSHPTAWLWRATGSLLLSWPYSETGDEEPWLKRVCADRAGNVYWVGHVLHSSTAITEDLVAARRSTTQSGGDWNGTWANGSTSTFAWACAVRGSALYVVGDFSPPGGGASDQYVLKFRP